MRTRVKICGLTCEEDARAAAGLGADLVGFVLADSPRRLDLLEGRRWIPSLREEFPALLRVGVFVGPDENALEEAIESLGLDLVQIHGGSPTAPPPSAARPVVRACRPEEARDLIRADLVSWAFLVDTPGRGASGGTGKVFDWGRIAGWRTWGETGPDRSPPRLILAGGLDPENVGEAVKKVRPWGVDASSRLESQPGRKDPRRVARFIEAVRRAEGAAAGGPA